MGRLAASCVNVFPKKQTKRLIADKPAVQL